MIVCTRCGEKNSDKTLFCTGCGKKLQSSRKQPVLIDRPTGRLEPFRHDGVSPVSRKSLMRMLEAWGYVAILVAVAVVCICYKIWWPLYPAVGLLGLLIWHRQI